MIRRLDTNGDWVFGSGKGSYIDVLEGLALRIRTQLKEWVGDCFFALDRGIGWHIMDKHDGIVLRQIRSAIMGNREVLGIGEISFERLEGRKWKLDINVLTIYDQSLTTMEIYVSPPSDLPPVIPQPPMFLVIVVNGSPSSGAAAEGSVITVTANEPPDGYVFSHWDSDPSAVFANGANATSNPAYFIMPPMQIIFTAVFKLSGMRSQDGRQLMSQDGRNIATQDNS